MKRIRRLGSTLAAVAVAAIGLAGVVSALPIRQVDWNDALARHPGFTVVTETSRTGGPPRTNATLGSYVMTVLSGESGADPALIEPCEMVQALPCTLRGWPVLSRDLYGDLDGDGLDEAVIPLVITRAGPGEEPYPTGLLIFREGAEQPDYVTAVYGYWWGPWIENNRLVVGTPGHDSNGNLVSNTYSWWRLAGSQLILENELIRPCNGWGGDCPYFGE